MCDWVTILACDNHFHMGHAILQFFVLLYSIAGAHCLLVKNLFKSSRVHFIRKVCCFVLAISITTICSMGVGMLLSSFLLVGISTKLLKGDKVKNIKHRNRHVPSIIKYGGGPQGNCASTGNTSSSTKNTQPCKNKQTKRRRDEDDEYKRQNQDEGGKNPKRGRPRKSDTEHICGPCSVWVQTGSNPDLLTDHSGVMRHPGDKAAEFSKYLSNGTQITLNSKSCMCNSCYRDCVRGSDQPRWYKINLKKSTTRHCTLCCADNCCCGSIIEWGPSKWYGNEDNYQQWIRYFRASGDLVYNGTNHDLCKSHYVHVQKLISSRKCKICSCDSDKWILGYDIFRSDKVPEYTHIDATDWVCFACYSHKQHHVKESIFVVPREQVLTYAVNKLELDGVLLLSELVDMYKTKLSDNELIKTETDMERETAVFRKVIKTLLTKKNTKYRMYYPNRQSGTIFYSTEAFTEKGVVFTSKFLWRKDASRDDHSIDKCHLRSLVKKQCDLLPRTIDFDYRTLNKTDGDSKLEQYFEPELMHIIESSTTADRVIDNPNKRNTSEWNTHDRKLKAIMICSLLANLKDGRNTFLQTLLALYCYGHGLRDKGFKLLNAFGITCSIRHVRDHGARWAKARSAVTELDVKKFWRLTFDNLDFHMKYAKKVIGDSVGTLNRMLHLITSQVSFRTQLPLYGRRTNTTMNITELKEEHFKVTFRDTDFKMFNKSTFDCTLMNIKQGNAINSSYKPLIEKLRMSMPHNTPTPSDKVVFTLVDEAYSGSAEDVGKLVELKTELHIGEEGFPAYIIIGGDQQMYAHVKNLKSKHVGYYDWLYPVPGDWHIMKNTSEIIKKIILDGGFRQISGQCGHKGEVSQWQDIHNVILATYESLLRCAVEDYCKTIDIENTNVAQEDEFWKWVYKHRNESKDELCKFWLQMLLYMHAYIGFYFAVRSGNWGLRNSCLKVITEMYFAYGRDKYEVLSVTALADSFTYPPDVLDYFMQGEFTVSVKGRPYHNLAFDEAHECIINRKLKQITTRPSCFRMVELAGFMAYLETVLSGVDSYVFKYHTDREYEKKSSTSRTRLVHAMIRKLNLFSTPHIHRSLHNVFSEKSQMLDASNVKNLLEISSVGNTKMNAYIKQYILVPPTEVRQKRTRSKLQTFTKKKETHKRLNTKIKNRATKSSTHIYSSYHSHIKNRATKSSPHIYSSYHCHV